MLLYKNFLICFLLSQAQVLSFRTRNNDNNNNYIPTCEVKCCGEDHTITITGKARTSFPTNLIKLGFTVETKDLEASNSFSRNSEISNRVDGLLNSSNIPEKNITTVDYQIYPKYVSVYNDINRTTTEYFDGYVVKNQIDVKLSDKKLAAVLIDKLVNLGVNKINYINFEVEPERILAAKKGLLEAAVKDAFDKADILAENSEVKIVDVKSVSISDYDIPAPKSDTNASTAMRFMVAEAAPPTIYASEKEVSISVYLTLIVKKS